MNFKIILAEALLVVLCTSACTPKDLVQTTGYEQTEVTQSDEQQKMTQTEGAEQPGFVSIDLSERRIEIPKNHFISICKDTYAEPKTVYDKDILDVICEDINNAEIVQMLAGIQELITMNDFNGDYVQYPISLKTACEDEYVSIEKLAQAGTDYYIQLDFVITADNLKHADGYDLNPSTDGRRYINCVVKSEKLYHDILNFWGEKVTINDIQNPDGIKIFYDNINSAVEFTQEDIAKFTQSLPEDAYKVFDDHSFGITIAISMPEKSDISIYYADDGCNMFQIDGESYNLNNKGEAASIVRKYIERLEKNTNEKNN